MVARSKQRTAQHLIDTDAQELLRAAIPKHWVLREYRPDYGLDFALEVFSPLPAEPAGAGSFETMGEHLFIQLKGCRRAKRQKLKLYGRYNVEKRALAEDKNHLVGELEVLPFSLEVSELVTVQRMGAALPVLLVVAELESAQCFFVCLNDYIDKVLIPKHVDYADAIARTIHIPTRNVLSQPEGLIALRWYAKRPKFYAAFQKFVYQDAELGYASDPDELSRLARHFAALLLRYDFWDDTEMWKIIRLYGMAIRRFLEQGRPTLLRVNEEGIVEASGGDAERRAELLRFVERQDIPVLWRSLAVLPRNYEETCREWLLPTPLGFASSYQPEDGNGGAP
jgi:hypothetical protein